MFSKDIDRSLVTCCLWFVVCTYLCVGSLVWCVEFCVLFSFVCTLLSVKGQVAPVHVTVIKR